MDRRLFPELEVVFDESAQRSITKALNASAFDWIKRADFNIEELLDLSSGDVVSFPGLPATCQLRVTGKHHCHPAKGEPFIQLTFSGSELPLLP